MVVTKLAMFAAGLVLAAVTGWGLGDALGPTLTVTPPGAPVVQQHPHPAGAQEAP